MQTPVRSTFNAANRVTAGGARVNLPGRYALASRRDPLGNRREFGCRAMTVSTDAMVLVAPRSGPVGERVLVHLEHLGKLEGRIVLLMKHGFGMTITATDEERQRIASRLEWLEKQAAAAVSDARRYDRHVPNQPVAALTFPGGIMMSCRIVDISASGAAVYSDYIPNIGLPVSLGHISGRVVRRFAEGFAMEFDCPLNLAILERTLADP
jgi:hypothetical protein